MQNSAATLRKQVVRSIFWDIETRSVVNLRDCGSYIYATDPTTEPLCLVYAVDDEPPRLWLPTEPPPDIFLEIAIGLIDYQLVAHNWEFERAILEHVLIPRYGFLPIVLEIQDCSQRLALANAYPAELGLLAQALGLPYKKDPEARKAMLAVSRPKANRKRKSATTTPIWDEDPAKLALVYERCTLDVITTRAVYNSPQLERLSATERRYMIEDAAVNARGVRLDRTLAAAATELAINERTAINLTLQEMTDGAITSVNQNKRFLAAINARGHDMASMNKKAVAQVLAHKPDDFVRRLLELRQIGARAAVTKFRRMLAFASPHDDRLRGTLRMFGTATGRWSGLGPQLQNLKKNESGLPLSVVDSVRSGDRIDIARYGAPLALLGDISRATLCAAPGTELKSGDFSAIESVVLAWLAGEQWKLAAYRTFLETGDTMLEPYRVIARRMLHKAPDAEIDSAERQLGKAAELASGFGGSVGAWRRIASGDPRTDDEIKAVIHQWRAAHPTTLRLWKDIARALRIAIRTGEPVLVAPAPQPPLEATFTDGILRMRLPSGRAISYPGARLVPSKFEDYPPDIEFHDNAKGQWKPARGWFGIFVENAVSGVARDLLAAAIDRCEAHGLKVVFHCHDEITIESPLGALTDEAFRALLLELPPWAEGLPLGGKVHSGVHYLPPPEKEAEPLAAPDPEIEAVEAAIDDVLEEARQDPGEIDDPELMEREDDEEFIATLPDEIAPLFEMVTLPLSADNKACCPFHDEVEPSCAIYADHFHCLAGETKVMTWDGDVPIKSLTGRVARLLTRGGEWVDAPIRSFGAQRLWRISLSRNRVRKDLYATAEHRWFVLGGKEITTAALRTGHCLEAVFPASNCPTALDPEGVRHGVVFGDGTMDSNRNGFSCVNLWGEKGADLRGWFEGYPQRDPHYPGQRGQGPYVEVRKLPDRFKRLPSLNATPEYLAGFLAGYLATDGHVAADGTVMLHSCNSSVLDHVRLIGTRLGIGTHGVTSQMRVGYGSGPSAIYRIHFATEQMWAGLFIRVQQAERFTAAGKAYSRHRWQVRSVEPTDRAEEVFCARVVGEAAFALEDNILTGNCFGCREHGDRLDWLERAEGMTRAEAIAHIKDWPIGAVRAPQNVDATAAKLAFALSIWEAAGPFRGTLAEPYLDETRAVDLEALPPDIHNVLRFHPACVFGPGVTRPCLIALMRDPLTDAPVGIQRIALEARDGRVKKIERRMLGQAGVIKLWPVGETLAVGEGLETVLAAATRIPYRGSALVPAWAALSTVGLKALPIIPGVRRLILLADNDENQEGQMAAAQAAMRWQAAGREVATLTPPTPGSDFNDLVLQGDAHVAD